MPINAVTDNAPYSGRATLHSLKISLLYFDCICDILYLSLTVCLLQSFSVVVMNERRLYHIDCYRPQGWITLQ